MKTQTPRRKKLAVRKSPRKKKLPSAFPPSEREDISTHISLVSGRERMWQFHFERLEQSQKQTRDAKREIKKLKKKVDQLHATIGFLLTQ